MLLRNWNKFETSKQTKAEVGGNRWTGNFPTSNNEPHFNTTLSFPEGSLLYTFVLMDVFLLKINNRAKASFSVILITPQRGRWRFENWSPAARLHSDTLLLLFNVLNHIVVWQKVRCRSKALIKSVSLHRYGESISFHVSMGVCRALPDARTPSEWHSDTCACQGRSGSRQPGSGGQTSGCYREARVILEGRVAPADSPQRRSHFVPFKVQDD